MATLEDRARTLDLTEERLHAAIPKSLARSCERVESDAHRLSVAGRGLLRPYQTSVARHAATLDALSPLKVLGRGYALARDAEGHVLSNASQVEVGEEISVLLGEGELGATVTSVGQAAS
jgi:exodeoxyribonuclease VII large subunit